MSAHQKKILPIDEHVGVAIAGLTADARFLRLALSFDYNADHFMIIFQRPDCKSGTKHFIFDTSDFEQTRVSPLQLLLNVERLFIFTNFPSFLPS